MEMKEKIKDTVYGVLFLVAFFFVGSGMLEGCVLALLERLGL